MGADNFMVRNEIHTKENCPECNGEGFTCVSKREFFDLLERRFANKTGIFRTARAYARVWKARDHMLTCRECYGAGKVWVDR